MNTDNLKLLAHCDAYHATESGVESSCEIYSHHGMECIVAVVGDGTAIGRTVLVLDHLNTSRSGIDAAVSRVAAVTVWETDPESIKYC